MLSQSINAKLQNDDFKAKKEGKDNDRTGYSNGSFSELEVSENDDWGPEEIKNRGLKMLNFMEERWNIRFQSDDKLKIILPGVNNLLSDSGTNNP